MPYGEGGSWRAKTYKYPHGWMGGYIKDIDLSKALAGQFRWFGDKLGMLNSKGKWQFPDWEGSVNQKGMFPNAAKGEKGWTVPDWGGKRPPGPSGEYEQPWSDADFVAPPRPGRPDYNLGDVIDQSDRKVLDDWFRTQTRGGVPQLAGRPDLPRNGQIQNPFMLSDLDNPSQKRGDWNWIYDDDTGEWDYVSPGDLHDKLRDKGVIPPADPPSSGPKTMPLVPLLHTKKRRTQGFGGTSGRSWIDMGADFKSRKRPRQELTSRRRPMNRATKRIRMKALKKSWVDSLADPCNVIGMKIPDGNIFPTETHQVKIVVTLKTDTSGYAGMEINPKDFLTNLTSTATSRAVNVLAFNVDGEVTGAGTWTVADQSGQPDVTSFTGQAADARIVSMCMKGHYIGSTFNDAGVVAGGILRGQSYFNPPNTGPTVVGSIDLFQDSGDTRVHSIREGIEVRWVPSAKDDLEFEKIVETTSGTTTTREDHSGIAITVNGVTGGVVTPVLRVVIYINFEYVPRIGHSSGTPAAGLDPGVLNRAAAFAADSSNLITAVDKVVTAAGKVYAAGSMVYAAGGRGYARYQRWRHGYRN